METNGIKAEIKLSSVCLDTDTDQILHIRRLVEETDGPRTHEILGRALVTLDYTVYRGTHYGYGVLADGGRRL